ncbi:hypothetical protein FRB98_001483 [Tulasnella sp. 332]|nr:hypothetical protein FRB98_001483 [Tulasnella sp. 332]
MATDLPPSTPPRRAEKFRARYALNLSPRSVAASSPHSPTFSVNSFRSSPTSSDFSSLPVTPESTSSPPRAPLYRLADRFQLYSSDSVPRVNSECKPALESYRNKELPALPTSIRSPGDSSSSVTATASTRKRRFDESTLAADQASSASPLRSRAKLWTPWGPGKKEKPSNVVSPLALAPAVVLKNAPESDTEFEEDESDGDEDPMMRPPDTWKLPRSFQAPELGLRNGSRQLRCGPWEVPYPISYDKVLMDTDDQTHELVKALIPTRNCLSFYEFAKPPSTVLDLGCGVGRWVVEAANSWRHTRFVGLDLMAIQYDLSGRCFDGIRDRVQWVQTNFLHYQIPFAASTFDYIRMSHVALAVPTEHWRHVIYEIRRVLKPGGVLEWIDEDPVLPLSPNCSARGLERAASLQAEFESLIHARKLHKPATTVKKLLNGRALRMRTTHVTKIRLALPDRDTKLLHQDLESSSFGSVRTFHHHQRSPLRMGKSSTDFFSDNESKNRVPRSANHFMPPGLVVLPEGRLLPLAPSDITTQATRNFQLVLGAAEAIWQRRLFHDPNGANRAEFEQEIWEYERGGCARLHLPAPTWDKLDSETTPIVSVHQHQHPRRQLSLSTLNHRRKAPLSLPYLSPSAAVGSKPTIVRSIFALISVSD